MGKEKKVLVGGQAVIEGVMMKGPEGISVSVRKGDGSIVSKKDPLPASGKFYTKMFFFRGIYNLIEMLIVGIKALIWSSNQVIEEEEDEEEFGTIELVLLLMVSFGFAIALFVALPYFLTHIIGIKETTSPIFFNLVDGIIKIAVFFLYLVSISLMKDIKRLFQYHGAEHKSVHCYEHKEDLIVKNVKKYTTVHPRCGTSFIMIVLFISIFIFALIPPVVMLLFTGFSGFGFWAQKAILFPLRILFIPVIAGISYEILRTSARHENNPILKIIMMPGLLVQKITTSEPDEQQIEVAIDALKKVI